MLPSKHIQGAVSCSWSQACHACRLLAESSGLHQPGGRAISLVWDCLSMSLPPGWRPRQRGMEGWRTGAGTQGHLLRKSLATFYRLVNGGQTQGK